MAEPQQQQQQYYRYQDPSGKDTPSSSQVLVLATLLPFGASLLVLAGLTLAATVIGLAVVAPLFVIFSPVLLPAALVIGLAVAGFLTSGAFGVTSLSSFAWLASYIRRSRLQERLLHAKDRAQEILATVAQRAKEAGESVMNEAQETQNETQSEAPSVAQSDAPSGAKSEAQSGGKSDAGKAQEGNKTAS